MLDILSNIYHDDPLSLQVLSSIETPQTAQENKIRIQLRVIDEKAAEALAPSIEALADQKAEQAFYSGVRFGARLMAELLEDAV